MRHLSLFAYIVSLIVRQAPVARTALPDTWVAVEGAES